AGPASLATRPARAGTRRRPRRPRTGDAPCLPLSRVLHRSRLSSGEARTADRCGGVYAGREPNDTNGRPDGWMGSLPTLSRTDTLIGLGLHSAGPATVLIGAVLGAGREILLVAFVVQLVALWL